MSSKPLPSPIRDDRLPALPPSEQDWAFTPAPPPKNGQQEDYQYASRNLAPISTSNLSPMDPSGLHVGPITPISPMGMAPSAPPSPSGDKQAKKKTNPLTDLVETEKVYVDLLTGIIRKVASAWSRSNLPPPELDTMFRSIESVYKANRSLLAKLKEIGANPSSPKALGDLLMRWIDDLEPPYTKYCTKFCSGFDEWAPVQSNSRLRATLAMFSSTNPPLLPYSSPEHPAEPPIWSLDELFLLPKGRLKYYKKLYNRLLKSTTPGRSDHRLLTGALDKLDGLLATLDERSRLKIGDVASQAFDVQDEVILDLRAQHAVEAPLEPPSHRFSDSTRGSGSHSSMVSQETAPTSAGRGSTSTLSMPLTDLERRLSTERTLDIFTMQPKSVRLQITPPNLHYTREMRISADVVIDLVPKSTGVHSIQQRGHIYILTDLLLMCERMSLEDQARYGQDGPDMWLLYPPLAGKHLRVAPVPGSDTSLSITILRKETVTFHADSPRLRDKLIAEFSECIDAAALCSYTVLPGKNQGPPPPVPTLPGGLPGSPAVFRDSPQSSAPTSPPSRPFSPGNSGPPSRRSDERALSPPTNGIANLNIGDINPPSRTSSMSGPNPGPGPGPMYPPRITSAAPSGPSFAPGQVMSGPMLGMSGPPPPTMGPSGSFGPGQVMPPPRATSRGLPPGPPGPSGFAQPSIPQGPSSPSLGPPHMGLSRGPSPYGQPGPGPASRPPSAGSHGGSSLHKSPSSRSLASQHGPPSINGVPPPMPPYPDGLTPPNRPFIPRSDSSSSLSSLPSLYAPQARPLLPSAQLSMRSVSAAVSFVDPSPPSSPVEETPQDIGPVTSTISAQMKCKVFLKEHHAKWKSLGSAKLKLYHESPTNIKQLVAEADSSKKNILISTIVLADGVERVGKTGVAIELSNNGQRTGIVYMIQLRSEKSAAGLFESLLQGSDRSGVGQ